MKTWLTYSNKRRSLFNIALFTIIFAASLLVISAVPESDDEQLFASAAQSFVVNGRFTALQMFGNDRVRGIYTLIAPLHPLIGALIYKIAEVLKSGGMQIFFLLSPIYTALTGVFIAAIALKRDYSFRVAGLAATIFAFSTIALPYSKTYFREPLAMLLITASLFCLERAFSKSFNWLFFTSNLVLLGMAIWTKEFLIVCLPFYLLKVIKNREYFLKLLELQDSKKIFARFIIIIFVLLIVIFLIFRVGTGRLSLSSLSRLWSLLPGLPHDYFINAFLGALISPAKGLILYSPVLLLTLSSFFTKEWKKHWDDFAFAIGSTLGMIFLQAFIYDAYWWNFTWGTRFLLPIIPFWIILLLPWLEKAFHPKQKFIRWVLFPLFLLGVLIQLGEVLISDEAYVDYLWMNQGVRLEEAYMWQLNLAPATGHWKMISKGETLNFAWLRVLFSGSNEGWLVPILSLILITAALVVYFHICEEKNINSIIFKWAYALVAGIIIFPIIVLFSLRADSVYQFKNTNYWDALNHIYQPFYPESLIIIDAYNQPLWYFYFNFGFPQSEWISLPAGKPSVQQKTVFFPRLDESLDLLVKEMHCYEDLWLISEEDHLASAETLVERLETSGFEIKQYQKIEGNQSANPVRIWQIENN